MKILLLGANGQVGWELQRSLAPLSLLKACDRQSANLEDFDQLQTTLREFSPDIIVNAAAYTAVDNAESEAQRAHRINAEAVSLIADQAKRLNAWLIHYSTDYVFDGSKSEAYTEADQPNPLSVYGTSKLRGEEAIVKSGCKHLIFRTSWVFAHRGANFAKTMLRLARERDQLKVVSDQIGAPTSAELIADITSLCLYRLTHDNAFAEQAAGIYHLTPSGETSWHGFAKYVISEAQALGMAFQITPEYIEPIATKEYPLPAKRPANSRLDTKKLSDAFGVYLPPWQTHAKRLVTQLATQGI
ncbi:MAG: dTDP-4-dehydrorhamnose reductase [Porticoccaceae bacterium]|nr:dTDP-4-dehydrorhamnose reductase [Porticoccaceae bacterium]